MDVPRARSVLGESRFSRIDWVEETISTNADLAAAAQRDEGEQVLGADYQSGGRGRLGRIWQAPRGASVLCSFLVRPPASGFDPHLVTAALGLAAARAVQQVTGWEVGIKWPNDLVAAGPGAPVPDDRKLAGILAESVIVDGRIISVVAGIGINVNWPDDLPPELVDSAVSLRHLVGHDVDRTDLLIALAAGFEELLGLLDVPEGPERLRDLVVARSATLGRTVRVERPAGEIVGEAIGLTPEGHLLVRDGSVTHEVGVGDVIHLRPIAGG